MTMNPMLRRLLTFPSEFKPLLSFVLTPKVSSPVPTISAINGHCYAGGLMLSLVCDYRIMTDGSSRNAWLCMNEVCFLTFSFYLF